jgi:hypothetical protein
MIEGILFFTIPQFDMLSVKLGSPVLHQKLQLRQIKKKWCAYFFSNASKKARKMAKFLCTVYLFLKE